MLDQTVVDASATLALSDSSPAVPGARSPSPARFPSPCSSASTCTSSAQARWSKPRSSAACSPSVRPCSAGSLPESPIRTFLQSQRHRRHLGDGDLWIYRGGPAGLGAACPRDYLSQLSQDRHDRIARRRHDHRQPEAGAPAINHVFFTGGPTVPGQIFPFLFITIMCGAISGFHALVSSRHDAEDDGEGNRCAHDRLWRDADRRARRRRRDDRGGGACRCTTITP